MKIHSNSRRWAGFSLVELMVAMAIGIFIIGALGAAYLTGRQAYRSQDVNSRLQEAMRYAFEAMSYEIRMAGYTGCGGIHDVPVKSIACGSGTCPPNVGMEDGTFQPIAVYTITSAGAGWTNNPAGITPLKGTNVISIRRMNECGASLVGNYDPNNANVQISSATSCGFNEGDVLMITNCSKTDIFRAENVSSGGGKITIAHSQGKHYNSATKLPDSPFGPDSQIAKFKWTAFYVALNAKGIPALYSVDMSCAAPKDCTQELAEDIYDIQAKIGIDADSNGALDGAYKAPVDVGVAEWSKASSLVLTLSARSKDDGVATQTSAAYQFNGASVTDRRLKQSLSSTVGVRNMLP